MYAPNLPPSRGNVLAFPGQNQGSSERKDMECPGDASSELRYALTKLDQGPWGELAIGGETEDGEIDTTIHKWVEDEHGARWQIQNDKVMRADAQGWLRTFAPDQVNGSRPKSCIDSLVDLLVDARRFVPKREDLDLIPLRNAYLVIEPDGTIRCIEPDRSYGVDYVINADLDMSRVDPETKIYTPAPSAPGSYWHGYITSCLIDEDVRGFAQEALSSVLLSRCYEKGIWLYGEGENGKSVMLHLLEQLAPKHTAAIRLTRLVKDQFGTAKLNGKRLATVGEMPPRLDREVQTILKGLISRDATSGEKKGRDEFSFKPKAVWIFATNHHPDMSEHEHGFWRKIETIPFVNRVDPKKKVLDLQKKIAGDPQEMRQFIDWLLIGAQRLTKEGWRTAENKPEAVKNLATTQRRETDTVSAWLHDCEVLVDAQALTRKRTIYAAYREFVLDSGKHPIADNKFWARMKEQFREAALDTEGEQKTVDGKRERCVTLVVEGISPDFDVGRVKRALASGASSGKAAS